MKERSRPPLLGAEAGALLRAGCSVAGIEKSNRPSRQGYERILHALTPHPRSTAGLGALPC